MVWFDLTWLRHGWIIIVQFDLNWLMKGHIIMLEFGLSWLTKVCTIMVRFGLTWLSHLTHLLIRLLGACSIIYWIRQGGFFWGQFGERFSEWRLRMVRIRSFGRAVSGSFFIETKPRRPTSVSIRLGCRWVFLAAKFGGFGSCWWYLLFTERKNQKIMANLNS